MNGQTLTLGVIGALALTSHLKKKGSLGMMAPIRTKHRPTQTEFTLTETHWGWEVEAVRGGKPVGGLKIAYAGEYGKPRDWKQLPCADQIEHIAYQLDSSEHGWVTPGEIYEVKDAFVNTSQQGLGIGTAMYEMALRFLPSDGDHPNLLMANVCVAGETSEKAQGVWQALSKRYIGGAGGSSHQEWGGVISSVKSLYPWEQG